MDPALAPPEPPKTEAQAASDVKVARLFAPGYLPPKLDVENNDLFEVDDARFFCGSRRAGKSTCWAELMLKLRRLYPVHYVYTKTFDNNFMQQFVPVDKITEELDPATLNDDLHEVIAIGSERLNKWVEAKHKMGKWIGNPYVCITFEDYISEDSLRLCKALETIACNGRHKGLSVNIMSQSLKGLTPRVRNNFDWWFIWPPKDDGTRQDIRLSFGNEVFAIAERCWAKGWAFVVCRKSRVTPDKSYYYYDADVEYIDKMMARNVVLGSKKLWEGIDIAEQKDEYPYFREKAAKSTLMGQLNEKLGHEDEDVAEEKTAAEQAAPTDESPTSTEWVTWGDGSSCLLL